jgi:enamine deaminase RidA (YjgF/YER057c/UK114 family)
MDVADGAAAAKVCAISLLAQVKAACGGDLDRLVRVVKLTGFVNSTGDFGDQPKVINGASDFLVEALGDAGRHSRSAVSAASLPFGVAVEIEGVFQIRTVSAAMILPHEFLSAPIAHRALHDADQGIPENSRAAVQRRGAGRLRHRDRRAPVGRWARDGVPRRHARPADDRDRPGREAHARELSDLLS